MASHRRGEFLAQYRASSSHTFLEHFLLSSGAAWYYLYPLQNIDKTTCFALCLQSPTETEFFFGTFHMFGRRQKQGSLRGSCQHENGRYQYPL